VGLGKHIDLRVYLVPDVAHTLFFQLHPADLAVQLALYLLDL
jgi:hypothetical protein